MNGSSFGVVLGLLADIDRFNRCCGFEMIFSGSGSDPTLSFIPDPTPNIETCEKC